MDSHLEEQSLGDTQLDRLRSDRRNHRQAADAGRDPGGCIITMLLGVAGAFVGGFLYRLATGTKVLYFGFDLGSFAIAVLGAVVILAVYRLLTRT